MIVSTKRVKAITLYERSVRLNVRMHMHISNKTPALGVRSDLGGRPLDQVISLVVGARLGFRG